MKWLTEHSYRNRKRLLIGITALILAANLSGCALLPTEEEPEALPAIDPPKFAKKPEYPVKKGTFENKITVSGKIMSLKEETLFFTLENRRIKEVYFQQGATVKEGQVIAELDMGSLDGDVRRTELQIQQRELTLKDAEQRDAVAAQLSKIDLELQKEELARLKDMLAQSKIKAPFSGTLSVLNLRKGEFVKPYEPVGLLTDISKLTAAVTLSQDQQKDVAPGLAAVVEINNNGTHQGKVRRLPTETAVAAMAEGGAQQEKIEHFAIIDIDQMPKEVVRGTPLSVSIITTKKEDALTVPLAALRTLNGRTYVIVTDDQGNRREVDVEVGLKNSTEAVIEKGLEAGQKVVGR